MIWPSWIVYPKFKTITINVKFLFFWKQEQAWKRKGSPIETSRGEIQLIISRGDVPGVAGGVMAPPDFGRSVNPISTAGLSSTGVPGVPWHPQILVEQLTLSQLGGADCAHHIITGISGNSDLPTALNQGRGGASCAHQIILAPPDFQTFLRPWFHLT